MLDEAVHHIDSAIPVTGMAGYTPPTVVLPSAAPVPTFPGESAIDALFRRWRAADTFANAPDNNDDDETDRRTDLTRDIEEEIQEAPPSMQRAAALLMIDLRWRGDHLGESPSDLRSDSPISDGLEASWSALERLRPFLSGFVGEIAADYLDHPDREIRHCRLLRSDGREQLVPAAWPAAQPDPTFDVLARESKLHRKANAALRRDEEENGEGEAEHQRYLKFEADMMATAPMTVAGFAAVVERWIKRHGRVSRNDGLPHKLIMSLIKASKATAQPAAAQPEPVDVLFSEWCDTQEAMNQENMLDDAAQKAAEEDPSSRWNHLFDRLNEIEAEVIATSTSSMRTAAVATFELAAGTDHGQTPRMLDRGECDTTWLALDTLALVRPHLTGRLAEIVGDLLDHPDRPFRDSKLHRLWTTPERAAELRERQREPMLLAAE